MTSPAIPARERILRRRAPDTAGGAAQHTDDDQRRVLLTRNFWDGRANNLFNGVGVFGPRDIAGDPNKVS